jgi:hypothetical protein
MTLDEFNLLSNNDFYNFITNYKNVNPKELALKLSKDKSLPARAIAEQIDSYQKSKNKLPTLRDKILFDRTALEQASSETTAKYKSSLISGANLIDLTGGLGIDDIFFASSFNKVTYCDLNNVSSKIFEHNISKLMLSNISVNNTDSIEFLKKIKSGLLSWIYIDPSRRDNNRRSVDLEYCAPNVYDNLDLFFDKAKNVMIKVAPAFDLTEAVKRFPNLYEIHVISVDGECKEVLLLLNKDIVNINPKVFAVKLNSKNDDKYIIQSNFNNNLNKETSKLGAYFYEPDCSIIKSNLTPLLSYKLKLSFLNEFTPYLTNSKQINDFPGRYFRVVDIIPYNEKEIKKYFKKNGILKANVARRNFKMRVDEIRKRFKIKDGGEVYVFFTTNSVNEKIVIITRK